MIRVALQPEPHDFDHQVRQPGLKFLRGPRRKLPEYWTRCLVQLWKSYGGVCAYLCIYIPRGTGGRTVEHFAPKSRRRALAYEWSNYRLVCSLMNARKRDFEDVLDPFQVQDGWFILELSSLEVLPLPALKKAQRQRVEETIERLKLNDPECLAARRQYYDAYLDRSIRMSFELLQRWSPFVAKELVRQGIVAVAKTPAKKPSARKPSPRKAEFS